MKLSLRGQLALWYAVAIPVLILALTFTAQAIMVSSLRASLDATLEERAKLVAARITPRPGASSDGYADLVEQANEKDLSFIPPLLRIADSSGKSLVTFGDVPDTIVPILDRQLRETGTAKGRFDSVKVGGRKVLRTYTLAVRDPATQKILALVQVGGNPAHVAAAENRLRLFALAEGVVGSIVVLGVGTVVLRRGFKPLDRILSRVHEIETRNLQPGLPHESRPPELQRLANSLNAMWERLDLAFKARETLFASVSHDLRTPLTALQGQIDVLLLEASVNSAARESLRRMAGEVRRLVRLTNNLLLNAQLGSHLSLRVEDVSLRELLEEVVAEMWVLADDSQLDLSTRIGEDIHVFADRDLLKQMALNVVENAIKFTPGGGTIEVTLKKDGRLATIEVADSGIGIPSEHLPHVMEPFYKVERRSGNLRGGAGLGLAIAKRVADLHRGRIEIHSHEGVGTTVTVSLPLRAVAE